MKRACTQFLGLDRGKKDGDADEGDQNGQHHDPAMVKWRRRHGVLVGGGVGLLKREKAIKTFGYKYLCDVEQKGQREHSITSANSTFSRSLYGGWEPIGGK